MMLNPTLAQREFAVLEQINTESSALALMVGSGQRSPAFCGPARLSVRDQFHRAVRVGRHWLARGVRTSRR